MARKASTPNTRAASSKREIARVRRKYKTNLKTRKNFIPGEMEHVADMVVILKIAGYPNGQIGKVIGISRGQVKELLAEPAVADKLLTLRAALPQAALQLLEGYLIEAVQAVVDVMRCTTDDAIVLKAAAEVFDRAGLPKASRQERLNENRDRLSITDDEGIVEHLREASPEVQEKAAVLVEELQKLLKETANDEPS